MLGIHEYNDTDVNVCNSDDAYTVYFIDYEFMLKALQGKAKCKGMFQLNLEYCLFGSPLCLLESYQSVYID